MALHGTIQMNGETIGVWGATARPGRSKDDTPSTYDAEVLYQVPGSKHFLKVAFTVQHAYTDGALGLAAKILTEAERVRKVDSL
jgi:hypothetical protein